MTFITLRSGDQFHRIVGESVRGTRIARIHGLDTFSIVSRQNKGMRIARIHGLDTFSIVGRKNEKSVDCSDSRIGYFLHHTPQGQEVRGLLGNTD